MLTLQQLYYYHLCIFMSHHRSRRRRRVVINSILMHLQYSNHVLVHFVFLSQSMAEPCVSITIN